MAHGTPDYNLTNAPATTFRVSDMGELAVRLGSIVNFDRRGDVVWLDDFEHTTGHGSFGAGGLGAASAHSTGAAKSGDQSLLLTAGSNGARTALLQKALPAPVPGPIGNESSWLLGSDAERFSVATQFNDGATVQIFEVRYVYADQAFYYLNAAGAYVALTPGVRLFPAAIDWASVKLVVDLRTAAYVRLQVNDRTFTLPGVAGQTMAIAATPYLLTTWTLVGRAGFNDTAFVDDVIITQNEQ